MKSTPRSQQDRLAVIMPEYPAPSQTFIRRDITALRELGALVEIFSTRPPEMLAPQWGAEAKAETTYLSQPHLRDVTKFFTGIFRLPLRDLIHLARKEGRPALRDLFLCIPLASFFASECKKRGITHIHAHMSSRAATIASLASYMSGIPYSVTLHGQIRHYGPNQSINWSRAAFGIAVNSGLIEEVRETIAPLELCPMITQPMGVDNQFFSRKKVYLPHSEGEPLRIFSCGRINRGKGHDTMLDAMALLVEEGVDVHLEIAGVPGKGQAQYATDLQQMIESSNLGARITFLGACSEEQVRDALNRSHIFALASRSEGLGMVYVEALSCAVPTIGTNVGGVPEVIKDGETGLLIPPDDPRALADAIKKLAADHKLAIRLSNAGREWAILRFDVKDSACVLLRHAFPENTKMHGPGRYDLQGTAHQAEKTL